VTRPACSKCKMWVWTIGKFADAGLLATWLVLVPPSWVSLLESLAFVSWGLEKWGRIGKQALHDLLRGMSQAAYCKLQADDSPRFGRWTVVHRELG